MARINLLDTRTTSFGNLISNGKIYRVPPYQRDYSWNEENWEDLWQDILVLHDNPDSSHYMGAIVLQNSSRSDKEFTIIDGQQRLATLSIIAIAVIDKIQNLVDKNEEKEANQERQEILKRTYLGDKDPSSLRYSSKILLNENNNDFYQSYWINLRKPLNIRSLTKSNQLIWQSFQYFSDHLEELLDVIQSGKKLAVFLTDIVAQRLLFIQINVETVKDGQQAFELLDQLENYSSLFLALSNANDDFWCDSPENRPYIRELELFRVKQAYPILFIAYEQFSPEDFTRLLKLVSVLSFRYTVVSSLNPNDLETLYNAVAIAITNGEITNPKQVFDKLRSVYVKDEKFQQDFSLLSISTKGQKKKLARYILYKLEKDASGMDINEDSFSLEHILPESPNIEWRENFTDTQIEEMVYRLGNLTPLEPPKNRQIGNELYSVKQQEYQQSMYKMTQNILAEQWTPDTIYNRQKELAKRAIHIWKSDFL